MPIRAWAVTTGEMGMRTQARGLAQAVADEVEERTLVGRWPWLGERPSPPWPDLIVTCGRRSATWAVMAKRLTDGAPLFVHVQDPRRNAAAFDLVVAMAHDTIRPSPRVIKVTTALHDVTPQRLAAAAGAWRARFAPLGRPLTGVAIGGSLRGRRFTSADGERLLTGLRRLKQGTWGALAITPSRRTPPATLALLREAFAADPRVFLWDFEGENPFLGILALADRLVVTSDSVSMVSEALAAGPPVDVFDLGFARHAGLIEGLVDRRLIRRFEGDPAPFVSAGPVDATQEAAAVVHALLYERTWASG